MMTKERINRIMKEMSLDYIKRLSIFWLRKWNYAISAFYIRFYTNGKRDFLPLENEYCGDMSHRTSERIIECRLLLDKVTEWKKSGNANIIEVGAVSPYVFPNLIEEILDCYDKHEKVTKRMDLFDFDFSGYDVISISTIEHVGTGDYNNSIVKDATYAIKKILDESRRCLITIPIGYNKLLDEYIYNNIKNIVCYKRGKFDNNFVVTPIEKCIHSKYSAIRYADAICVIEK